MKSILRNWKHIIRVLGKSFYDKCADMLETLGLVISFLKCATLMEKANFGETRDRTQPSRDNLYKHF